jgi:hypothetical protein
MVWKMVSVILIFIMAIFSFVFMFENLPKEPVELINYIEPENVTIVNYGAVPVFSENLRFNHNLISYSIQDDCDSDRRSDMIAAFNIFVDTVDIISFYEVENEADILVGCSDDFIKLKEDLFAAGEGGPSKIINTSLFKTIEEGKITLYNGGICDYPIVALHELCHVFGFDHSKDPENIMFAVANCEQKMSDDMAELMTKLYSIEALADAKISKLNVTMKGRYIDFNISILNEGMIDIEKIILTVFADEKEVEVLDLGEIGIGYGRTLRMKNVRIPRNIETLKFILDAGNETRELNDDNNFVEMSILGDVENS